MRVFLLAIVMVIIILIPVHSQSKDVGWSIGTDIYGLPNYDVFGISFKKFFNDRAGIQMFFSPKYFSYTSIDCGIGFSPIINLRTYHFGNHDRGSELVFQFMIETLYRISGDVMEAQFDHLVSITPCLGIEFFITRNLSLGYKIGYGFLLDVAYYRNFLFKLDLKRPNSLQNILLYIPVNLYFY